MTNYIAEYIKTVRHLFPIMGKPEKAYLRNLGDSIQDFFAEHPPDSTEEVITQFGPPEDVVNSYLASAEPDYLIMRIKRAKLWRILAGCSLAVLLVAVAIFSYQLWLEYDSYIRFMDDALGYVIETIE